MVASIGIAVTIIGIFHAACKYATGLIDSEVIKGLPDSQAEEFLRRKRHLASCLLLLVLIAIPFVVNCIPVWFWIDARIDDGVVEEVPFYLLSCLGLAALLLSNMVYLVWIVICLRSAMRDPNTTTVAEKLEFVWFLVKAVFGRA